MNIQEFTKMTGATPSPGLYDSIETEYLADARDKATFCREIFGNRNTTKTIRAKWVSYLQADNRRVLTGLVGEGRIREMDDVIESHYRNA